MKRLQSLLQIALCLLAMAVPVLGLMPLAARANAGTEASAVEALALAIASKLDSRVANVLPCIDGAGSKLLALRSYLRSSGQLAERWSWTQEQITAYEGSTEQNELNLAVQRVREAFEKSNPGFELFVNPQVRSLDIQLASWNSNESVAAASARLLQDTVAHLGTAVTDARRGTPKLEAFLRSYSPDPAPTVAAPGLSLHGQARAVDFQVHRGEEIVAGPDTRSIGTVWEQGGWAAKLELAVREAGKTFRGPLVAPREPWHYTYTPVVIVDQ
jgi:hypothetical protein